MEKVKSPLIEWGVASWTLEGQHKSGDLYLVKPSPGEALIAVVDGIGHGERAAVTAQMAIDSLRLRDGESLPAKLSRCHEALRQTAGVVLSVASFRASDSTMTWLGVGNVEGILVRARPWAFPTRVALVPKNGLVGDCLPPVATFSLPVARGDVLIFATDGVRPDFAEHVVLTGPPQQIADRILARHLLGTDDALVLAARYVYGKDQASFR
jgi:hypothetical protein